MSTDYTTILNVVGIGGSVYSITQDYKAAGVAAGYSAFIRSITGDSPIVSQPTKGRVLMTLSPAQAQTVRGFIESTAKKAISATPGPLTIDLNPVIAPTALKWGILAAVAAGAAGFLLAKYM
jgi:hypothetical protein